MNDADEEIENQDDLDLTAHPHQMGTDTQIRIAKEQSSIFELLRKESRGDLVLAPDFQRGDVWKRKQQSELIESILIGIPIPLIYLFEDEEGVRQIIDGKQRVTALKQFVNDKFPLTNVSMLPALNGKKYTDIIPKLRSKLEDYQLHCYVIQPPTPEYVKFNIFERVNRGGLNLNKQEMRHALYQGKATTLIKQLADSEEFNLATGGGIKSGRMRDRYLVLRLFAFYLLFTGKLKDTSIRYKSDIDTFLAAVMKYVNSKAPTEMVEQAKNICLHGMDNVYHVLGDEAFRFDPKNTNRRPVNMGLFEVLVFAFCEIDYPSMLDREKVFSIVNYYKQTVDDEKRFSGSFDSTESVEARFNDARILAQEFRDA